MKVFPLKLIKQRGTVEIKYVQWTQGFAQCKGADGYLYPLASFRCDDNFINFCNAFDIWNGGRDSTVQAA